MVRGVQQAAGSRRWIRKVSARKRAWRSVFGGVELLEVPNREVKDLYCPFAKGEHEDSASLDVIMEVS